jgi:hypothetical protein
MYAYIARLALSLYKTRLLTANSEVKIKLFVCQSCVRLYRAIQSSNTILNEVVREIIRSRKGKQSS